MKISTRLRLAVFVPALMALVTCVTLVFSYQDVRRTQENGDTVRQIRTGITELNHIVFSYILYNEERPKQQFSGEHDSLSRLIAGTHLPNPEQQQLLDNIRRSNETLEELFRQLVSSREVYGQAKTSELKVVEDQLTGLLLLTSYEADSDSSTLRRLVDNGVKTTETRTTALIFLVMVLASVPLTIIMIRTRRSIISSLSNLADGAAIIGSGKLDYRIEDKRSDEIGELSRAFNRMSVSLKDVTASKLELEKEVTEREEAEAALREAQAYLNSLLDYANAPIIVWDASFTVTRFNHAFERLTGMRAEDVIGRRLDILFPETTRGLSMGYIKRTQTGERFETVEIPIARRDGSTRTVLWNSATLFAADSSTPVATIAQGQDISERKAAEEDVKRLNAELSQNVSYLEAANKELEAFSYSVSHDLRAPLRAMSGFSQVLLDDYSEKLDEEGKRYLGIIASNAQKMGQLISDLLAFSRLSRASLNMARIDMADLARKVFAEQAAAVPDRVLDIRVDELPPAHGDASMVRQALENLASNAVKFTRPRAAAAIHVGFRVEGGESIYYVRDNGVGFDMQYRNKLFSVFQRLHREADFEGTGVGLAIVQRIVMRHGGRVWAEAAVGEGATFYFTLPGNQSS